MAVLEDDVIFTNDSIIPLLVKGNGKVQIYKVEEKCKDMIPEDRRLVREERSRPILDGIFE